MVFDRNPVIFLFGALNADTHNLHIDGGVFFLVGGKQRFELECQAMLTGFPALGDFDVEFFTVFPDKLFLPGILAVDLQAELAFTRVEIEAAVYLQGQCQNVASFKWCRKGGRDIRGFVERQALCGGAGIIFEIFRGKGGFGNDFAYQGDCDADDLFSRLHVFFEQQRGHAEHIADVVEPIARVI